MHYTYDSPDRTSLCQGDLIRRSDHVDKLLQEVHPHYHRAGDYKFLAIITQSCDLIRRDGERCGTRYISLAAVRPLSSVLRREIEDLQYTAFERKFGFCDKSRQEKFVHLLERLLNNNESRYFYYHREPNFGFEEDCCAFLQLSIAVKASLHYETLVEAKVLQLKEAFQHKLGYLVGNMYSRVGTEDWLPKQCTKETWMRLTRDPADDPNLILWLERDIHTRVITALKKLPDDKVNAQEFERIFEGVTKDKEQRRSEMLDTIRNTLIELNVDEEVVGAACRTS